MKICTCGTQNAETSFFCRACGKPLPENEPIPAPVPNPVIAFLNSLTLILGTMFALCGVASPYLHVGIRYINYDIYASFYPDPTCSLFALMFGAVGIIFAIIHLIQNIAKANDSHSVFHAITRLICAAAVLVVGIVMVSQ